jgi:glycosyltransferase involved in cell wall biosynthesis
MQSFKKISIVIPVFNEENNIEPLCREVVSTIGKIQHEFELIFVDDGSTDRSLSVIKDLAKNESRIYYIELSRNFGQQYALKAGMDSAKGDCVISMDCDLQHPPELLLSMIAKWEEGNEVVYTRRNYEQKLPWLKRKTSLLYYDFLNKLSDIDLDYGVADFRLLDRKVVDALANINETGLFLRGLVKWAGFKQAGIDYSARDRMRGKSKYRLRHMLAFGLEGVLSFSTKPLLVITYVGLVMFGLSLMGLVALAVAYFTGLEISNTILILWGIMFFCSMQMMIIGIICLYVGKLVVESRHRPPYLIRDTNYRK